MKTTITPPRFKQIMNFSFNKLLEKVEELTLYIIEQNKRIETLEKKIE